MLKRFKLTGRIAADLFAWPEVEGDANIHGPLSFVIPSAVAGLAEMHGRWGRLPLAEVAAPSVALAKRGLPQDWYTTLKVSVSAPVLRKYPESARIYLRDGLPPVPPYQGALSYFRLGKLSETLDRLARAGWRDFYEGEIASRIVGDSKAMGGVLSADDLLHCRARVLPSVEVPWRTHMLQTTGPLTAAPTAADVVRQMADARIAAAPDAQWYVALARALKGAYARRLATLGDAEPQAAESCTTHISVCDEEGTMVAITTTLLSSMGSRVVLPSTGILMNNGVMWFDPRPGQPNSIAPGKRPLTNMFPVILRDGDKPWIVGGASGGRRIMAAVLQLVSFVADFGMTPEAAAHQPRIDVSGPDKVTADDRLAPDILRALQADGATEIVRARRPANQLRVPQSADAEKQRAGWHQRCRFAVVCGGGSGLNAVLAGRCRVRIVPMSKRIAVVGGGRWRLHCRASRRSQPRGCRHRRLAGACRGHRIGRT